MTSVPLPAAADGDAAALGTAALGTAGLGTAALGTAALRTGELRTGELAAAAGVNRQTLRYYERRGLLPVPERSLGGQRRYPPSAVTRLRVIKAAQRLGFTLDEVRELIHPARHRSGSVFDTGAGLQGRAAAKLAEVDHRITELQAVRDTLARALAAGCDDLVECAPHPDCPVPFSAPS